MAQATHCNTHVNTWRRHRTHTHRPEVAVNFWSTISHPGSSLLQDPPGAVGSFSAPGDQVNRPSRSGTDRSVLFFLHTHTQTHTHTYTHQPPLHLKLSPNLHFKKLVSHTHTLAHESAS